MPQLVYLQIGSHNFEQFQRAVASVRRFEPDAEVVLYTDQLAEGLAGVEVRPWRVKGASDLARCGSTSFARLTHEKIRVMRDALQRADGFIVFSDVDIMACKPFMEAARKTAQLRPVSISSEGDGHLPVQLCSGLLILKEGDAAMRFLDLWAEHHLAMLAAQPNTHNQDAFNDLVQSLPDLQDTWGRFRSCLRQQVGFITPSCHSIPCRWFRFFFMQTGCHRRKRRPSACEPLQPSMPEIRTA